MALNLRPPNPSCSWVSSVRRGCPDGKANDPTRLGCQLPSNRLQPPPRRCVGFLEISETLKAPLFWSWFLLSLICRRSGAMRRLLCFPSRALAG